MLQRHTSDLKVFRGFNANLSWTQCFFFQFHWHTVCLSCKTKIMYFIFFSLHKNEHIMPPCWLWVGGRMIYNDNTCILTSDLWAFCIFSLQSGGGGMQTQSTMYIYIYTLQDVLIYTWFHVVGFNEGSQGFKAQVTLLLLPPLLLYDFPLLRSTWIFSSYYICKSWRQSHRKENRSSFLALQPFFLHFSLSHCLSGEVEVCSVPSAWHSEALCRLCPPSSGQNESGVAVHDDRIYVVGGYSIWTNEPLACIQVTPQNNQMNWYEIY